MERQTEKPLEHLDGCPFTIITYPLKCFNQRAGMEEERRIERILIGQHLEKNCSMRLVTCEYCHRQVQACEVNMHLEICM